MLRKKHEYIYCASHNLRTSSSSLQPPKWFEVESLQGNQDIDWNTEKHRGAHNRNGGRPFGPPRPLHYSVLSRMIIDVNTIFMHSSCFYSIYRNVFISCFDIYSATCTLSHLCAATQRSRPPCYPLCMSYSNLSSQTSYSYIVSCHCFVSTSVNQVEASLQPPHNL